MRNFDFLAQPWWVNLFYLVPILAYLAFRKKLSLTPGQLIIAGLFGIAFGFVEASVVIYIRSSLGLLPGFQVSLSEAIRLSSSIYNQPQALTQLPQSFQIIETIRETATMIMLAAIALLAAKGRYERWAVFLWTFAVWDIFYYVGLYFTVRWPQSLLSPDVLFLLPVPWYSQVWFPLLISLTTMIVIAVCLKINRKDLN